MKNTLLLAFFSLFNFTVYSQNTDLTDSALSKQDSITFICEIQHYARFVKGLGHERDGTLYGVSFVKHFKIEVDSPVGVRAEPRVKEAYYPDKTVTGVEMVIQVPSIYFENNNNDLAIGLKIVNKNDPGDYESLTQKLTLLKYPQGSTGYINEKTFELQDFFSLGYPEEVTVTVITDYLKERLFNEPDSLGGFSSILPKLESLTDSTPFSSVDLMNFYSLFYFLEPFVDDSSFFNEEGKLLFNRINDMQAQLADTIFTSDLPTERLSRLSKRFNYSSNVYRAYVDISNKIRIYYNKVFQILFAGKTNRKRIEQDSTDQEKKEQAFRMAFGVGMLTRLGAPLYDVYTSPVDSSVQFEKNSSFSPVISAALLWAPFSGKTFKAAKDTLKTSIKAASKSIIVGVSLNYYFASNLSSVKYNSQFGLGFGLGYGGRNWRILAMLDFRNVRQPRQYFIDEFRGENKKFPNLELADNSIFINQLQYALGFTFCYLL